jgi:zinc transporter, ZIP family
MNSSLLSALFWGTLAASSLLIGYFLAGRNLSNRTVGMIMGFGSGALIAAIAYELVPASEASGLDKGIAFGLGAAVFFVGDWAIDHQGGSERKSIDGPQKRTGSGSAIFLGTLLDAIPESLIFGMSVALGGESGIAFLAAVFISNVPEAVAGTINLKAAGHSSGDVLWRWVIIILISAGCSGLGYIMVGSFPTIDGHLMSAFAAGAMLTMLAEAMMPEAYEHGGKLVGIFTVLGFLLTAMLS